MDLGLKNDKEGSQLLFISTNLFKVTIPIMDKVQFRIQLGSLTYWKSTHYNNKIENNFVNSLVLL